MGMFWGGRWVVGMSAALMDDIWQFDFLIILVSDCKCEVVQRTFAVSLDCGCIKLTGFAKAACYIPALQLAIL